MLQVEIEIMESKFSSKFGTLRHLVYTTEITLNGITSTTEFSKMNQPMKFPVDSRTQDILVKICQRRQHHLKVIGSCTITPKELQVKYFKLDVIAEDGSSKVGKLSCKARLKEITPPDPDDPWADIVMKTLPDFQFSRLCREIDWNRLRNLDLKKMVAIGDTKKIEAFMNDVLYGDFSEEESDPRVLKSLALAQYTSQYLHSCRQFLQSREHVIRKAAAVFEEEEDALDLQISKLRARCSALRRQDAFLDEINDSYVRSLAKVKPELDTQTLLAEQPAASKKQDIEEYDDLKPLSSQSGAGVSSNAWPEASSSYRRRRPMSPTPQSELDEQATLSAEAIESVCIEEDPVKAAAQPLALCLDSGPSWTPAVRRLEVKTSVTVTPKTWGTTVSSMATSTLSSDSLEGHTAVAAFEPEAVVQSAKRALAVGDSRSLMSTAMSSDSLNVDENTMARMSHSPVAGPSSELETSPYREDGSLSPMQDTKRRESIKAQSLALRAALKIAAQDSSDDDEDDASAVSLIDDSDVKPSGRQAYLEAKHLDEGSNSASELSRASDDALELTADSPVEQKSEDIYMFGSGAEADGEASIRNEVLRFIHKRSDSPNSDSPLRCHSRNGDTDDDDVLMGTSRAQIPPDLYGSVDQLPTITSPGELSLSDDAVVNISEDRVVLEAVFVWQQGCASEDLIEIGRALEVVVSSVRFDDLHTKPILMYFKFMHAITSAQDVESTDGSEIQIASYFECDRSTLKKVNDLIAVEDSDLTIELLFFANTAVDPFASASLDLNSMRDDASPILMREIDVISLEMGESIGSLVVDVKGYQLVQSFDEPSAYYPTSSRK